MHSRIRQISLALRLIEFWRARTLVSQHLKERMCLRIWIGSNPRLSSQVWSDYLKVHCRVDWLRGSQNSIYECLAEREGFESARKRKFNNMQGTDGNESTW